MVITTRFGNTAQLHLVNGPGGYRKQLTFHPEPAAHPMRVGGSGAELVYARDEGGDEYYEYFHLDIATGISSPMACPADSKLKNSAPPLISPDGKWMAYSSTRRNGKDKDIWVVDLSAGNDKKHILKASKLAMVALPNVPQLVPCQWKVTSVHSEHLVSAQCAVSSLRAAELCRV